MIEEQRTNLLTRSSEFDNAAWSKVAMGTGVVPIVTTAFAVAPDGTLSANRIQMNRGVGISSNDYSLVYNGAIGSSSIKRVKSVWIKSNTGADQTLVIYDTHGAIGETITATPSWQRFILGPNIASVSATIVFGTRGGSSYFSGGDQILDILAWGAQIEDGSFATSYIPTTTTAVTRAADNLTVPTTGGWFTTSSGSFSGQFQEASAQNTGGISRVMGSSLLGRFVYRSSGGSTYNIYDGTNIVLTASMPINSNVKISSSYGSNGLAISANGAAPVTGSFDGTWGDQGFIWVGSGVYYTGYISKYNFYPSQLSNTQLQLLTQ